jgi:hypothetical protein
MSTGGAAISQGHFLRSWYRSTQMPLVRYYSALFQDQLQAPYIGDVLERIEIAVAQQVAIVELGLKGIVGQVIDRPRRNEDLPDRDRLATRFEQFKKAP